MRGQQRRGTSSNSTLNDVPDGNVVFLNSGVPPESWASLRHVNANFVPLLRKTVGRKIVITKIINVAVTGGIPRWDDCKEYILVFTTNRRLYLSEEKIKFQKRDAQGRIIFFNSISRHVVSSFTIYTRSST